MGHSDSWILYTTKPAKHQSPPFFPPPHLPPPPRQARQRASEHHWQKWQSGQGCFFFPAPPPGQKNNPWGVASKRLSPNTMNFLSSSLPFLSPATPPPFVPLRLPSPRLEAPVAPDRMPGTPPASLPVSIGGPAANAVSGSPARSGSAPPPFRCRGRAPPLPGSSIPNRGWTGESARRDGRG